MFPTFSLTGFVLRFHWMYTNLAIGAFYWKEAAKEEIMTETGRRGLHGHDRIHGSSLLSQIEAPVRHCRLLNPAIVADFFLGGCSSPLFLLRGGTPFIEKRNEQVG